MLSLPRSSQPTAHHTDVLGEPLGPGLDVRLTAITLCPELTSATGRIHRQEGDTLDGERIQRGVKMGPHPQLRDQEDTPPAEAWGQLSLHFSSFLSFFLAFFFYYYYYSSEFVTSVVV